MHDTADARGGRRSQQVPCPLDHHAAEALLASLPDRHEVDDGRAAVDGRPQAGRIGHVPLGQCRSPRLDAGAGAPVADEDTDVLPGRTQRMDDVPAHEARPPGDEDHPVGSRWKFCQYLEGVGPRWPWYFEPSSPLPYGVAAGSLSCTNEIWPIFISG